MSEEGDIQVFKKILCGTSDFIIFPEMANTQVDFELREQEEVKWS